MAIVDSGREADGGRWVRGTNPWCDQRGCCALYPGAMTRITAASVVVQPTFSSHREHVAEILRRYDAGNPSVRFRGEGVMLAVTATSTSWSTWCRGKANQVASALGPGRGAEFVAGSAR